VAEIAGKSRWLDVRVPLMVITANGHYPSLIRRYPRSNMALPPTPSCGNVIEGLQEILKGRGKGFGFGVGWVPLEVLEADGIKHYLSALVDHYPNTIPPVGLLSTTLCATRSTSDHKSEPKSSITIRKNEKV
jgi:hypothetical protein